METITNCLSCNATLPPPFLDLGATPLANAFIRPKEAQQEEKVYPLMLSYCQSCSLVQLTHLIPPEEMFGEYLYFSSFSEIFLAHAKAMASHLIERFKLNTQSRVLEIASNDGYLLEYFKEKNIPILGVEPAQNISKVAVERGIPTLNRFFDEKVVPEIMTQFGKVDVVIGNNVLAHVPSILTFLKGVKDCLKDDGAAVFEVPYVKELLDKVEFDTIYHEHVFYFSVNSIMNLIARVGLELFDVSRESIHGGSLRVFMGHRGKHPISENVGSIREEERNKGLSRMVSYVLFSQKVNQLKKELKSFLVALKKKGKKLAAYGAPAKGNTLLNTCGIGKDLLEFTVDRNQHKQGLLTPGMRIPIHSPDDLLKNMPDYTLILPWNIADEIMDQQKAYREKGGKFIIPIPRPVEV